ncbi:hypothetical protein [Thermovibrio ammonificans]|uniref:Uncharacterized protein n=1 Tax=Thermovibrio ammonificans (strain DSM 15698 / JCM 12110 / HB-1) TaxID=648996 RepID=E8T3K4_THEA1|nr:hypothetical protein [Thermovibrio ammonificans]ADU96135.1 hypothetical protein Theam_0162 [Thermovibrio ammonificans HB-1]
MNWTMFLWGLVVFLVISLPTITGLMRINSALKFLQSSPSGDFNPLGAIKPGGFAYALTFSFKITFLTAVILDYVEYVKQVYYIVSLYLFFLMIDFIVQYSGKEFATLSLNFKSAFVGASLPVFTIFFLNWVIQRRFRKLIPAEAENYKKGVRSPALKSFDQKG